MRPRNMTFMDTLLSDRQVDAPARSRTTISLRVEADHRTQTPIQPERGCKGLCFQALTHAYESVGGSVSSEQLVQRLRACSDQPISMLAHWIVDRQIVVINRLDRTLIPNFQFTGPGCSRRSEIADVIAELRPVFDDWELATWFVTPNAWLGEALPVKLIATDARRVFEAARVDRYVACG